MFRIKLDGVKLAGSDQIVPIKEQEFEAFSSAMVSWVKKHIYWVLPVSGIMLGTGGTAWYMSPGDTVRPVIQQQAPATSGQSSQAANEMKELRSLIDKLTAEKLAQTQAPVTPALVPQSLATASATSTVAPTQVAPVVVRVPGIDRLASAVEKMANSKPTTPPSVQPCADKTGVELHRCEVWVLRK